MRPSLQIAIRSAWQVAPAYSAFSIETAGRLEKDFVSWPHACETWEFLMELRHLRYLVAGADAGGYAE
jgi:hypothetical protein